MSLKRPYVHVLGVPEPVRVVHELGAGREVRTRGIAWLGSTGRVVYRVQYPAGTLVLPGPNH